MKAEPQNNGQKKINGRIFGGRHYLPSGGNYEYESARALSDVVGHKGYADEEVLLFFRCWDFSLFAFLSWLLPLATLQRV